MRLTEGVRPVVSANAPDIISAVTTLLPDRGVVVIVGCLDLVELSTLERALENTETGKSQRVQSRHTTQ